MRETARVEPGRATSPGSAAGALSPRAASRPSDDPRGSLHERIVRRRREHLEQHLDADPADTAADIVDSVLITASITDEDPARRRAARSLLADRHPQAVPGASDGTGWRPATAPDGDEGTTRRPATGVRAVVSVDNPAGQDEHRVDFDAPPDDEQCWGSGAGGAGCLQTAATDVGLCRECLAQIRERTEQG